MLYSIIIPAYNSHTCIRIALDSLTKQESKDFEIIIVDDASAIESYECLQKVVSEYNLDIKLYRQSENGGPGKARKEGLKHAQGKFILFLDSDDQLEPNALSILDSKVDENPDIVFFDCYRVYNSKKVKLNVTGFLKNDMTIKDFIALSYDSLCCMCIKKTLFDIVEMPELYNAEDCITVPMLISNSEKISFVNDALYDYNYRVGSLSTNASSKLVYGFLCAWQYLKENTVVSYKDAFEYRLIKLVMYGVTFNMIKSGYATDELKKITTQFTEENNNWQQNSYIRYLPLRKRIYLWLVKHKCFCFVRLYVHFQDLINSALSKK